MPVSSAEKGCAAGRFCNALAAAGWYHPAAPAQLYAVQGVLSGAVPRRWLRHTMRVLFVMLVKDAMC